MKQNQTMPEMKELIALFFVAFLGSAAGYLLDQNSEFKNSGTPIRFDVGRILVYVVLGLVAAVVVFLLLTEGRDSRPTDFAWSCIVAMKGAEWLQKIGDTVINHDKK